MKVSISKPEVIILRHKQACVSRADCVFCVFFLKRTGTHSGICWEATPALSAEIFWSNRRRLQRDDCCQPDRRHSPSLPLCPGPMTPLLLTHLHRSWLCLPLSRFHSLTLSQTQNLWPKHDDRYLAFTRTTRKITFSKAKKPVLMKLDMTDSRGNNSFCFSLLKKRRKKTSLMVQLVS